MRFTTYESITTICWLLLTALVAPVFAQNDAAYGTHARQTLDLHWPGSASGFPTVVFIHGGSLNSGDKSDDDYRDVWKPFPEAGIACATINYRLAEDALWPAQPEDCAAAVVYVRQAVLEHGGDAHRIFLMGHSSGAMLAALLGTDGHFLSARGMKPVDLAGVIAMGSIMWDEEFEATVAKVPAERIAALFKSDPAYRMFGTPEVYQNLWPMKHLNAAMPPFLFLIAESEQENPPILKHAKTFCEAARLLGVQAAWRVLPGRTHYSAVRKLSETDDPTFAIIRDFVLRDPGRL